MKSNWLSFAVSDRRQYSYINVTVAEGRVSMGQPYREQKARKNMFSPVKDIYCKEISLES
jgi:hypothetical protein